MPQPRDPRGRPGSDPEPEYTLYRSKPGFLSRLGGGGKKMEDLERQRDPRRAGRGGRPRITPGRVVLALAGLLAGWLLLSLLLFLVSAQIQKGKVSDATKNALDDGGNIVLSANTILVLGSDARPKGSGEEGANTVGQPSRSDTIMLLRVGGGKSARLSIPRDTVVDIPGSGRNKINAAYAIGGPQLTIRTVKRFLGIDVNHLIEVDFQNFPKFVDALGGIDFTATECVRAAVDGGYRNGGTVIRLRKGKAKHLDGKRVLALARIRQNDCRPNENDLDRARRQQQILSAIKGRVTSFHTFFRLPWVSWTAPKAIRTDMGGVTLMGLFTDLALSGTPPVRVLKPSGIETLPDGGVGLQMSEREVRSETRKFLKG
jgi:LCP family protein required for cell wall assembly